MNIALQITPTLIISPAESKYTLAYLENEFLYKAIQFPNRANTSQK